jgi:hypothetical protein
MHSETATQQSDRSTITQTDRMSANRENASGGGATQKFGGIAALLAAFTFVFGFVMLVTVFSDYATGDPGPREAVAFVVDHQAALFVWQFVILIAFGVVLVPLVVALHQRLRVAAPTPSSIAAVFGFIWAGLVIAAGMIANVGLGTIGDLHDTAPRQAESLWSALDAVETGLGGGNEIVGGIWVLLVSWTALHTAALPRALSYLGIVAGAAGLVTIIPALELVGGVFGLGLIVWFVWVGAVLLRSGSAPATRLGHGLATNR